MPKIAVLQMTSGVDPEANFDVVAQALRDTAEEGAQILFTPEMSILLDRKRQRAGPWIESDAPSEMATRLGLMARECGVDLALGSMPVASAAQWANRAFYFRSGDGVAQTYDKIHMFDVELATGETWRESNAYAPRHPSGQR